MTEPARAAGAPRPKVIARIADHLCALRRGHPLRVAVDGITAAGKSVLADEVADAVRRRGRPAIRLSTDEFEQPRERRRRQGGTSATGGYQEAHDVEGLIEAVLRPLGPDGDLRYRERLLDEAPARSLGAPVHLAPADAVVLVDGLFLQGRELAGCWDQAVFVNVTFAVARARGLRRDAARQARDLRRLAACRLYLDDVDPAARADVEIGNDDVDRPALRRIGGDAAATAGLFSYGTLRQPAVQLATFGRVLDASPDSLRGYRTVWVTITDPDVIAASGSDRHPLVVPSGDPADAVAGSVLTLTTTELAAADLYEVDDYRRGLARLGTGRDAWVYLSSEPDAAARIDRS